MPGREERAEKREVRFHSCRLRLGITTLPRVRRPIREKEQTCCLRLFLCPIVLDVLHRQLLLGGDSAVSPPCNGHNHTPSKDEVETYRREQAGWMESLTPTTVSRQNKNLDLKFTLKISSHRKSNVFKRAFPPHIELHQLLGIPLVGNSVCLTLIEVVQHKHKQVLSPHTFSHT